jgi:hypothetical protein
MPDTCLESIMPCKAKYWNKKGRFQKLYNRLWDRLVPAKGDAPSHHGQLLRYASRIYHDIYNNGGGNLDNQFFRQAASVLKDEPGLVKLARQLKVADFPKRLDQFVDGEGNHTVHDAVMDVVVKFAAQEYEKTANIRKLVEDAEWLLDFFEKYPPHFADGKSMETDLSAALNFLAMNIQAVKDEIGVLKKTPAEAA